MLSMRSRPLDTDDDVDGFSENQGDCNDHDAAIGPKGQFTLTNARFESPSFNCPPGTNNADTEVILIDALNNTCATASISSTSIVLTFETASGTTNVVGQAFAFPNSPFSPNTVAGVGGSSVARVSALATCNKWWRQFRCLQRSARPGDHSDDLRSIYTDDVEHGADELFIGRAASPG